jgi:signal transduction histidine kinase
VRTEEDPQPRRPRAGWTHRPSGAAAVAALALDHIGALIGMDAGWVIRSATGGLERLVGRPPGEVLGHSLRSLLEPDTAEATIASLAAALQSETRTAVPGTLVGNRPVLLAPLPHPAPSAELYVVVTDVHGGATGLIGASGPDPTEVFRARLVEIEDQHARRYAELRRELADLREGQARLVQAEKVAALARLGAGAAHEINNPLAVIVGNAELLLRREPQTRDATERVERILQAAHRVARVVRQILLFVRAHPPDRAPTDVVALLRDEVAAGGRDLALDGVRVIDELESLPVVQADARQLAQVFGNILDNALDAARALPAEQGRIVRLASCFQHGRIRLRIENSGSPIADESLPRIFDPFFTTKAVGQGAGLGLSVCHGIVTAHGGRIVAENLPHGVAIIMELPASGAPDAPDPRPAA